MLARSPWQPSFKKGDYISDISFVIFAHGLRFNTSDVVSLSCALLALELPMSSKATTNAKSNVRND